VASELAELSTLGAELAEAAAAVDSRVATRARRLGARLASGRFHVSVLGEFKSGKSTLVNALLGRELLPTGVVPVTTVLTEISFGPESATVTFASGARQPIQIDALGDYVAEERNPGNELGVERVEVSVPVPLLEPGLVLVDTPGIGSIHAHNTEAAEAAVLDTDGAILVLSADAPLSAQERDLLRRLALRSTRLFVVLNKADHLERHDRDQVRAFVGTGVARELDSDPPIWCISARAASIPSDGPAPDALDFAQFRAAFERFVRVDLVGERLRSARGELATLGRSLADAVSLRKATLDLDVVTLDVKSREFRAAAASQQAAFEDDCVLLTRDVTRMTTDLAARLDAFARTASRTRYPAVEAAARGLPKRDLDDRLRALVEEFVRADFEVFRRAEAARTSTAWCSLAERFRRRTEGRVNALRGAASGLFDIDLRAIEIGDVAEMRERFFYLFVEVGSSTDDLVRVARRLLPEPVLRRRARQRAAARLRRDLDKHVGRARWDLTQRLDSVRRRFEGSMRDELGRVVVAIDDAATRADQLRNATAGERQRRLLADRDVLAVASRAAALAETQHPQSR
jgi:GTP-binding protein EngB required for normal cell division